MASPWCGAAVLRVAQRGMKIFYFVTHATHASTLSRFKQLIFIRLISLVCQLATMSSPSAIVLLVSTQRQQSLEASEHHRQLMLDIERCERAELQPRIRQLRARERERINSRQTHIARRNYELRRFAQPLNDGELVQTFLPDQGDKLLSSAKVKAGLDLGCWYFQPQRSGGDDYLTPIDRQILLSMFILRRTDEVSEAS